MALPEEEGESVPGTDQPAAAAASAIPGQVREGGREGIFECKLMQFVL